MGTAQMRQRLHHYLEIADERKLKALYAIMEQEINEVAVTYTDHFKKELDRRMQAYEKGVEKTVSAASSKKRIRAIVQAAKNK